jgi:hypothetical protein
MIVSQSMYIDGGARAAWQKYFEWKHHPNVNFYTGQNKVSSLRLQATHNDAMRPFFPKRYLVMNRFMIALYPSIDDIDGGSISIDSYDQSNRFP